MEEDETKRLRYSIWPDQVMQVPGVWVYPARHEGEDFVFWPQEMSLAGGKFEVRELGHLVQVPDELYLREVMALDLMDEQALLGFVRQYGPLGFSPPESCLPRMITQEKVDEAGAGPDYDIENDVLVQSVESVRLHLVSIRDAVRLYQVQTAQIDLGELKESWELGAANVGPPEDMIDVDRWLPAILNPGLAPFQVSIRLVERDAWELGLRDPDIYSCLCLQLFNHVVEGAVYIHCHNERCNRLFVRQQGRAKQGQYRTTGVKYCSDYCARAQGQRELRKRKAGERKIGNGAKL